MSAEPREVHLSGAVATELHLLQGCSISSTGPAQVSGYFRPNPTGNRSDGLQVLQASFRGRTLMGVQLQLPEGYSGAVLERRQAESDPATAEGAQTGWQAVGTFDSFHYWNHDSTPLKSDGVRRCMEWAALAAQMHQPISPEAVEQAITAAAERVLSNGTS